MRTGTRQFENETKNELAEKKREEKTRGTKKRNANLSRKRDRKRKLDAKKISASAEIGFFILI